MQLKAQGNLQAASAQKSSHTALSAAAPRPKERGTPRPAAGCIGTVLRTVDSFPEIPAAATGDRSRSPMLAPHLHLSITVRP
jgi:hypothetical protein